MPRSRAAAAQASLATPPAPRRRAGTRPRTARSGPHIVLNVLVRPRLQQQLHHVQVPVPCRKDEGRFAGLRSARGGGGLLGGALGRANPSAAAARGNSLGGRLSRPIRAAAPQPSPEADPHLVLLLCVCPSLHEPLHRLQTPATRRKHEGRVARLRSGGQGSLGGLSRSLRSGQTLRPARPAPGGGSRRRRRRRPLQRPRQCPARKAAAQSVPGRGAHKILNLFVHPRLQQLLHHFQVPVHCRKDEGRAAKLRGGGGVTGWSSGDADPSPQPQSRVGGTPRHRAMVERRSGRRRM